MKVLSRLQERRHTIGGFKEMDFGDVTAELIDGLIVIAQAFPSDHKAS